MKTRVELVTEARAEAVRRLPMLDEGQSYKAGFKAGFVQAADWLFRQQNLQQCNVSGALPPVTLDEVAKKLGYIDAEHCQRNMDNNEDFNKWWSVIKELFGGNDR